MKQLIGKIGECAAEEYLRHRGFLVWKPSEFIRLLELVALYNALTGECAAEPREPVTMKLPTRVGYVSVTYWRNKCVQVSGRETTPLEASIYAPCVRRCVAEALGQSLLQTLSGVSERLLENRRALETVDLFAYKDGVLYAVEVKANGGKLTERQLEKAFVLRDLLKPLVVRIHLQNLVFEIERL
ncbi:MAG: hypothetical protein OWQ51_00575 [Pyrobaculum arsenaticum]|uniref:Endonuclease n=2 Tax=Pyrobaculum arsenaticum TaxID=121277 RepID=A4WLN9_PYRAR|nr:hypothetical protein [Pyrobaculum arsenaticum]ABP51306.1 conserved hypothetical protein [Pyrobaculum arsenaticum DSM 13514]MCY0889466.1 hypothetical protein [Pyrobaculum arsenaticum]NYR16323.1 hypothetical protein [Pyrobaculum arsenaticum]